LKIEIRCSKLRVAGWIDDRGNHAFDHSPGFKSSNPTSRLRLETVEHATDDRR
jgi:hypothetical protein